MYLSFIKAICDVKHVFRGNISKDFWVHRNQHIWRNIAASSVIRVGSIMDRSDRSSSRRNVIVCHYCRRFISDTFKSRIRILIYDEETGYLQRGPIINVFLEGPHLIR